MSRTNKIKLSLTEDQVRRVIAVLTTEKKRAEMIVMLPELGRLRDYFESEYKITCELLDGVQRRYDKWRERNEQM